MGVSSVFSSVRSRAFDLGEPRLFAVDPVRPGSPSRSVGAPARVAFVLRSIVALRRFCLSSMSFARCNHQSRWCGKVLLRSCKTTLSRDFSVAFAVDAKARSQPTMLIYPRKILQTDLLDRESTSCWGKGTVFLHYRLVCTN
jgi:hypothetical protein